MTITLCVDVRTCGDSLFAVGFDRVGVAAISAERESLCSTNPHDRRCARQKASLSVSFLRREPTLEEIFVSLTQSDA